MPFLGRFNKDNCLHSFISLASLLKDQKVIEKEDSVYKVFQFKDFLQEEGKQIEIMKDLGLTAAAKERDLANIIHQRAVLMASDHIALQLPRYEIDFRRYIREMRKPQQLNSILIQVVEGLRQLKSLGYVHRDLKPENIVINLDPLVAVLIDFGTATLITAKTQRMLGTLGYIPKTAKWNDGSEVYDIWAMGAIIMEADMQLDQYFNTLEADVSKVKAKAYIKEKNVCKHLVAIVKKTVLAEKKADFISLEELERQVREARFRIQKHDKNDKQHHTDQQKQEEDDEEEDEEEEEDDNDMLDEEYKPPNSAAMEKQMLPGTTNQ